MTGRVRNITFAASLVGMGLVTGFGIGCGSAMAQLSPVEKAPAVQPGSEAYVAATIGSFDLSSSKGPNTCRLTLQGEQKDGVYAVSIPAGCRRAFPVLNRVENWQPGFNGSIRLITAQSQLLLSFSQKASRLTTDAREEVMYELKPVDGDWFQRRSTALSTKAAPPSSTASTPGSSTAGPASPSQAAIDAVTHADGRYEVLRSGSKPSGCDLALMKQPLPQKDRVPAGAMKAGYVEGCQDRGMQIFDPVAWRTDKERLILIARKGHEIALSYGEKSWHKAVTSGDPLELRKR